MSAPQVELTLPATAESLPLARQVVVGAVLAAGMAAAVIDDLAVAVHELCVNAVVHAYRDAERPGPSP